MNLNSRLEHYYESTVIKLLNVLSLTGNVLLFQTQFSCRRCSFRLLAAELLDTPVLNTMAMLGVASRFSVLKIEGEEGPRNPNKKKSEKPKLSDPKKPNQTSKQSSTKKKGAPVQNGQVYLSGMIILWLNCQSIF